MRHVYLNEDQSLTTQHQKRHSQQLYQFLQHLFVAHHFVVAVMLIVVADWLIVCDVEHSTEQIVAGDEKSFAGELVELVVVAVDANDVPMDHQ